MVWHTFRAATRYTNLLWLPANAGAQTFQIALQTLAAPSAASTTPSAACGFSFRGFLWFFQRARIFRGQRRPHRFGIIRRFTDGLRRIAAFGSAQASTRLISSQGFFEFAGAKIGTRQCSAKNTT
jgi:hypothetical protein